MSAIAEIKSTVEAHTSWKCYADVPSKRPDEFVTVEVTGGTVDTRGMRESSSLAVQCWSTTTYKADQMAEKVMDALNKHLTDEHEAIAYCACGVGYSYPPTDGVPRYQMNLEIVRKREI